MPAKSPLPLSTVMRSTHRGAVCRDAGVRLFYSPVRPFSQLFTFQHLSTLYSTTVQGFVKG